ncbi:hypothetical protein AMAG_15426 [Allomyces macrogynus ATCC 38327]|uniref:Isochorismatase-like domain-containing protein n=1 Tax=Allomyces macrogynus (strain ATCC 38327) TaxID=578462 RepID=A0A0L0T784_ALLM3|nr:hypothetical protein AMAG_15426 [Allomyces macrogynus ATCC 38327]|eukprot:KNE70668.1 hypothetical protein AMAG_15426 [Allomyces macrogynus ATCC 38327]
MAFKRNLPHLVQQLRALSTAAPAPRQAAMLSNLTLPRTAFFLCDVQERFRSLIFRFDDVVSTSNKMVQASKILEVPLIVTEQHPKGLGHTVAELDIAHAATVLPKTRFSMCIPEVNEILAQRDVKNVVLFGIESHVCVTQTALDLLEQGVTVYILADGVSSMNSSEIPIALKRLAAEGAVITSSDSILFALLKDAKHDKFKQTSNLVKTFTPITAQNQLFSFLANKL